MKNSALQLAARRSRIMVAWRVILTMQTMTVRIRLAISLQNYLDTSDNGSEYQNDHSLENSLIPSVNDSEGQNVNAEDELTACSTDNESERSDKCLDLNDPKVIKLFDQPKPTEDPLWVNMFVYQRHKRKLLKLLRNPLGVKY